MEERMKTTDITSKQLASLRKYAGIGAAITAELMIGFWFGIGVMLAGWGSGQFRKIISLGHLRKISKASTKMAEQT